MRESAEPSPDVDERKRSTLRRFVALGATSPLVRLSGEETTSEIPDAIAGYLSRTPGAHFSKIRDDLALATGETQYHLRRLESAGRVESRKDGEYRRFYPAGRFSSFEQVALGYLRRRTPLGMIVALLRDPSLSAGALADQLTVARSTVSKFAGELETAGLLTRTDGYALVRPTTLLVLLVRYAESFGEPAVRLAAAADSLVVYDG